MPEFQKDKLHHHTPQSSNGQEHFTVDEIIGRSPGWILHSGMTVLLIVIGIGVGLTILIRYPDKISSAGVITTTDPFKPLSVRSFGVVDTVFCENDAYLLEGDPILYIHNSADRRDVEVAVRIVDQIDLHLQELSFINIPVQEYSLGPMQSTFAALMQLNAEYNHYLSRTDFDAKIKVIQREIEEIQLLNTILEQERSLSQEEIVLSQKDLDRNQTLFDHGIISERDLERSIAGHIGLRKSFLVKENNISQNRVRIAGLQQQKMDVRTARSERILLYQSRISEIIQNFRNTYNAWFQQYFVVAPAEGTIQLSSDIVPGQTVHLNEPIGYIVSTSFHKPQILPGFNAKYAKAWVPSMGLGKVKEGSRAIIHVDAYPYKEYGSIETYVEEIYSVPEIKQDQRFYEIHMPVGEKLVTDYGHEIEYNPEMSIQAIIIANERSLFHRIFHQFLNLINHHVS